MDQAGSADKLFQPMEGVYHEMLFEPEKDQARHETASRALHRAKTSQRGRESGLAV